MLLYVMDVSDDIENIKLNFSVPGFIVYPAIVMLSVSFVYISYASFVVDRIYKVVVYVEDEED